MYSKLNKSHQTLNHIKLEKIEFAILDDRPRMY